MERKSILRDWSQVGCHDNQARRFRILFAVCFESLVPSLKSTTPIFPEILLNQSLHIFHYSTTCHHVAFLHNTKTSISPKRKKIFQKRKHNWAVHWKAFQISNKIFLCDMHFNAMPDRHLYPDSHFFKMVHSSLFMFTFYLVTGQSKMPHTSVLQTTLTAFKVTKYFCHSVQKRTSEESHVTNDAIA